MAGGGGARGRNRTETGGKGGESNSTCDASYTNDPTEYPYTEGGMDGYPRRKLWKCKYS